MIKQFHLGVGLEVLHGYFTRCWVLCIIQLKEKKGNGSKTMFVSYISVPVTVTVVELERAS